MKTRKRDLLAALLMLCLLLSGCSPQNADTAPVSGTGTETPAAAKAAAVSVNNLRLEDKKSIYKDQDPESLVCFYITVKGGNAADDTNHTFEDVNSYRNLQYMKNVEKIKTEIIFQAGDENGPVPGEAGFGAFTSNATMNVRGRTSTLSPQKSYRIDLFESIGLWRGQRAIAINKHPNDASRLRNILYFGLLQEIPDAASLRTQFVRLYVKDETSGETVFSDYGLYTQIELPNGRFLRNHDLSRGGNLYKANLCELYRYPDNIRLATDPLYDLAEFSYILEPKTSEDHTKLITMLDAVNDYSIPITETVEKHFDIGNLTSYLAYNLLMANPDSSAQNYLLYSPVNSDTWYYLFWDGDGSLAYFDNELLGNTWANAAWEYGISAYWNVVLFNRMLRVSEYRQALADKVELLRTIITTEKIAGMIVQYRTVVDRFTSTMPDMTNLNCTLEQLELIYQNMPAATDRAYRYFTDSLEKPMPFFLGNPEIIDGVISLRWSEAYDFDAEFVYYDIQIATDWSFAPETIVFESLNQLKLSISAPVLPEGEYFWRVTAHNESGNTQTAFDQADTASGIHSGMRRLTVDANGEVRSPT